MFYNEIEKFYFFMKFYHEHLNITPLSIASKNHNDKIVDFLLTFAKDKDNSNKRIYLNVPYAEKDIAKNLGACFDGNKKMWYFINQKNSSKFQKWLINNHMTFDDLSDEQQDLIKLVKQGKNVLVDACIGSGKTTTIQVLCNELPQKKILYLTYNRLLKIESKAKIKSKNTVVTNYHGFASFVLLDNKIEIGGVSDLIQTYIRNFEIIQKHPSFDLLVIDEYQDIDEEISDMLVLIKISNPNIQIVAVGDMDQKIYDKTTLNASEFMNQFLENHESLNFTKCFRINAQFAARLGKIWNKKIVGVNNQCEVKIMSFDQIKSFIENQKTSDILCIGSRGGYSSKLLNILESEHPDKFNKKTVYSSIFDEDRGVRILTDNSVALFTTFDSTKGLERKICVVFDFTIEYWTARANQNNIKYEILRNVFCVAASRGKSQIIFADIPNYHLLTDQILSTKFVNKYDYTQPFLINDMFEFKYRENIEECFKLLVREKDETAIKSEINVKNFSGTIDLSLCISILQIPCEINFLNNFHEQRIVGFCDVLKDDAVWEIKFTSELEHDHYLQCAMYMIALSKPKGVIWNIRTNERVFISIPDRNKFMECVIKTITKGMSSNIEFNI